MVNHKKVYRIYTSLNLQRPKKTRKGRMLQTTKPENLTQPQYPNHVWAIDFIFIRLSNKRKVKILTVEDLYTRKAIKTYADFSIRNFQVIEVLQECFSEYGKPRIIRCDNGREFIAHQFQRFFAQQRISQEFIPPGKPFWNGTLERFNESLKYECLYLHSFDTLQEVRDTIDTYFVFYNEKRPHFALNFMSPLQYERSLGGACSKETSASSHKEGHYES